MEINLILKKLIESGMTQEEIGGVLGKSQSNIARWLNTPCEPKYSVGKKIEMLALARGVLTVK